jgi:hypothetical protein
MAKTAANDDNTAGDGFALKIQVATLPKNHNIMTRMSKVT